MDCNLTTMNPTTELTRIVDPSSGGSSVSAGYQDFLQSRRRQPMGEVTEDDNLCVANMKDVVYYSMVCADHTSTGCHCQDDLQCLDVMPCHHGGDGSSSIIADNGVSQDLLFMFMESCRVNNDDVLSTHYEAEEDENEAEFRF